MKNFILIAVVLVVVSIITIHQVESSLRKSSQHLLNSIEVGDWSTTYNLRDSKFRKSISFSEFAESMDTAAIALGLQGYKILGLQMLSSGYYAVYIEYSVDNGTRELTDTGAQLWVLENWRWRCLNTGIDVYGEISGPTTLQPY